MRGKMRGRENERENTGSWKISVIILTKSKEPMFYLKKMK